MRQLPSALVLVVLTIPITAKAEDTSTPTSTPTRFEVPAPHEETTEPDVPSPPHRDPMTLPVVMEHPEDKASMFSTEKTRFGINGGIGFPRPVGVAAFLQFDKFWSLGADYSLLPTTKISDVNLDFWAACAGGRLYPFHGAFYVGVKGGYQHLSASGYITQSGTTALAQGSVDTVLSAVGKLGTSSVPTVDLLRVGFVL